MSITACLTSVHAHRAATVRERFFLLVNGRVAWLGEAQPCFEKRKEKTCPPVRQTCHPSLADARGSERTLRTYAPRWNRLFPMMMLLLAVLPPNQASAQTITEIIAAGLAEPQAIAVDGAGNVYVTGRISKNAFTITPGSVITEIIDFTGDGTGNPLGGPQGITVDGDLCNWVDNVITLTANEPTYCSALTGDLKGVSPFTVLGLGCTNTDPLNPGGRRLRGYVLAIRGEKVG